MCWKLSGNMFWQVNLLNVALISNGFYLILTHVNHFMYFHGYCKVTMQLLSIYILLIVISKSCRNYFGQSIWLNAVLGFCWLILSRVSSSITMTSQWVGWRLKSPASRLFTQPFIRAQIKENIKAPRHWPLCGNSPGTGEFPAQMASNAETVSIWWRHHVNDNAELQYTHHEVFLIIDCILTFTVK